MLIDPPNKFESDIEEEKEEAEENHIDESTFTALDTLFFQPSEEDLDIAAEDAIALTEFLKEYGN